MYMCVCVCVCRCVYALVCVGVCVGVREQKRENCRRWREGSQRNGLPTAIPCREPLVTILLLFNLILSN